MKSKSQKIIDHSFSRRFFFLSALQGLLISSIGWRLFDLQLIENQKYEKLSNNNQFDYHIIPPERGLIVDRKDRILAGNMDSVSLILHWKKGMDIESILYKIGSIVKLSKKDVIFFNFQFKTLKNNFQQDILITKHLSHKDVAKLSVRSINFPEISFVMSKKRVYPQGSIAGHITGYTGIYSKVDIGNNKVLSVPGLDVGKTGLEKYFDIALRGQFGRKRNEVTSKGHVINSYIYENPISGKNLKISLDMGLQSFALNRLRKGNSTLVQANSLSNKKNIKSLEINKLIKNNLVFLDKNKKITSQETGSVIVMDVNNGEILCSVSSPSFNPNIFSRGLNHHDWDDLKNDQKSPLLNRTVSGLYSPGSTIKMAVALAALEAGIINYNTRFFCKGFKEFGNMKFHCWNKTGHGNVSLLQAIEQSCDVYFYELGLKVGIDKISNMMKRLGLGQIYNIEMNEKTKGIVPSRKWKFERDGINWTPGETLNAAIGQGYILTTPLQLVTMVARIANGKKAVEPTLLLRNKNNKNRFKDLNININDLNFIRSAMEQVVVGSRGTARKHQLKYNGIEMAGKTGTVQVVRISQSERDKGLVNNEDRPWNKRDHALFVGYVPIKDPKYAICVVVEHGGSGSSIAAPIARDIFKTVISSMN